MRIAIFFAQVVLENEFISLNPQCIIRIDWDLPATSWEVYHKTGYTEAGGVPLQCCDDLLPLFDRCPEVRRSLHQVWLKQVIGADSDCEEFLHQLYHNSWIIINSFEENGLTTQGYPGICESCAGYGSLAGDLGWMVKMSVDIERVKALEHSCQLWSYPLRKGAGDPCSDSNDLHVRNGAQLTQNGIQFPIGEQ